MDNEVVSKSIYNHLPEIHNITMLSDSLNHADKELEAISLSLKGNMGTAVAVAIIVKEELYIT